jgi:hypothetical protein
MFIPSYRNWVRRIAAFLFGVLESLSSSHMRGGWRAHLPPTRSTADDWTGLTEPLWQGGAGKSPGLGWIRPEAVIVRDGGRPTVRFHESSGPCESR